MEFGIQFFPDLGPSEQSGADYWAQALHLVGLCDELGYTSVRTVEHYFHPYGGYSPNPIVFLSAAAMLTKKARLITGAVLPTFNNPLKLSGSIGMLDAIYSGRSEVGIDRAFLPRECPCFKASLDESRARADRNGYGVMAIPMAGGQMSELTGIYRENWQSAGHPGRGLVMMAFHML